MLNLVFVHLGEAKADHLLPNIMRLMDSFSQYPVHLVLNDSQLAKEATDLGVPVIFYEASPKQNQILGNLAHDSKFRQGFWRFTLERLFALEVAHRNFPNDGLLHIESDVLILPTFPFEELENEAKLIWTTYNSTHDVSALLFSPNQDYSRWFVAELETEIGKDFMLTDMTALSKVRKSNLDKVGVFPSIREALDKNLKGSFDSAAIGMWLCGQDPRNHYGQRKLHKNDEYLNKSINFDPASFEYIYSPELGLQIRLNSQVITLHCLHVHSKDLRLLSKTWESALVEFVNLSIYKDARTNFNLQEFVDLVLSNIKQGTLLPFLAGIPPIYRLRHRLRKKT